MKYLVLALLTVGTLGPSVDLGPLCIGAMHAMAMKQERSTPPGEWCQRPETRMPTGAHACECHKQDCTDPDPEHEAAHTDAMCLNYCHQNACECKHMDCK